METDMKTTWLLSTICTVAIMASAPAWAQSTDTTTPMAAPSTDTGMAKPMTHKKWMKHKPMDMNGPSDADHSADMLNAEQLKNNMSPMSAPGSAMPMAPGSTMAPATPMMAPPNPVPMAPPTPSPGAPANPS
jgi:hypothetical protein